LDCSAAEVHLHPNAVRYWRRRWASGRFVLDDAPGRGRKARFSPTGPRPHLGPKDHIISADEKTSVQARIRCHPSLPPAPGRALRIEHEYERGGALQYPAAWDVQRGIVMGRGEPATGIAPFGRLVADVMGREPYCAAERVFWVVDNESSHRGQACVDRLTAAYANLIVLHTPVHASWLNQLEIYFSIIQRKVLTPERLR
jgi:hypothetical protein